MSNVCAYTDGVSFGDTVRVDVAPDGRLVAVEVVERSDLTTLVFASISESDAERMRRFAKSLMSSQMRRDLMVEGMPPGLVAVAFPAEKEEKFWMRAVDATRAAWGVPAPHDEEAQTLGNVVGYWAVAAPDWECPEPLKGADDILASFEAPDLVAVDWPEPDDAWAKQLPDGLVERLREMASEDPRTREFLERRQYLGLMVMQVRMEMMQAAGMDRAGRQQWPLAPGDPDDETRQSWEAAHGDDGRVRYCPDDEVNEKFRAALTQFGLDPDRPTWEPYGG